MEKGPPRMPSPASFSHSWPACGTNDLLSGVEGILQITSYLAR
jgi:hypothetical protein